MPELKEVVKTKKSDKIVNATIIDEDEKLAVKKQAKKSVEKISNEDIESSSEKHEKSEKSESKEKFVRPPIEQITRDFDSLIQGQQIQNKEIVKLGYTCGKIIFGFKIPEKTKDFRICAYKARKKSKTVEGKSRAIFYFGIPHEIAKKHLKEITGASLSSVAKCSVQSTAVELVVDKVTFKDTFDCNIDTIIASLTKLIQLSIEYKTTILTNEN